MDETHITLRQQKILKILALQPISREAISQQLRNVYPVSKTTLFRDLIQLEKMRLVKRSGVGKKTQYYSIENPLNRYVDMKEYFRENSSIRQNIRESFNHDVFHHLATVVSDHEKSDIDPILKHLDNQERIIDPTIFKRELERFTVEFSWKSSHIEGNTYTLLETELLIKQMREAAGHNKYEATMILNHKYALDYILSHRKEFVSFTLDTLITLHTILTKQMGVTPGIRKGGVAITGTNYLPLANKRDITKTLEQTVNIINTVRFPFTKALIAHAMVAYIHPFTDGNKRTARTIANALLIAHDLYPLSYRNLDDLEYLQALLIFYEQNSLFHLKQIFWGQVRFSAENYFRG